MRKSVQLILLTLFTLCVYADPQCLNQSGQKVDWFIALKLPGGTQYAYCDSNNCSSLKIQTTLLDDVNTSPLMHTLQQIENLKSDSYATLFWNDQPPTQTVSGTYAHAKGVIGVGKNEGFLLVHSTPKFPEIDNGKIVLGIRSNQQIYGQHYFCSSTSTSEMDNIAAAYNIDWPFVYDGNVPTILSTHAYFTRMLQNIRNNEEQSKTVEYTTLGGVKMTKLSKSGKWVVPFYENVAASYLKTGLYVESWGSPQEEPDCSSSSIPVASNEVIDFQQNNVTYKWTKDHSKYAISINSAKPFVCLGDINRQSSQWKRGGGTVCFANKTVYDNFSKIMVSQQSCTKKSVAATF